jgi:Glycosyl-4,4'-diaponeurosporenoate acyltransferase
MTAGRRLAAIIEGAPIAVMSALFLTPIVVFWMRVWGPLRPYDVAPVPVPSLPAFCAGVGICLLAAWVPASYFTVRGFERDGRYYRAAGVRQFRKLVPDGDWMNQARRREDHRFRVIRSRADAASWRARTEASEKAHLVLMLMGILSAGYALYVGWTAWAVALTAGNVVTNLYPVLLQRYTRTRLIRVTSGRASDLPSAQSR